MYRRSYLFLKFSLF